MTTFWTTGVERLDVVDELIGDSLNRLRARPGDMRREDEVRLVDETHERMVGARRLDGRHVESRARDLAVPQRQSEVRFVDKAATRGVDEERTALHARELGGPIKLRVDGINGQWSVMTSLVSSTSSKGV